MTDKIILYALLAGFLIFYGFIGYRILRKTEFDLWIKYKITGKLPEGVEG